MRRAIALAAFAVLPSAASAVAAQRWLIDLHGGAKICAQSQPMIKGTLYLFHRCQDGTFVSLAAKEVLRVREERIAEKPASTGSTTVLKRDLDGPAREPDPTPDPPATSTLEYGTDYGYYAWGWGGFCCNPPSPPTPQPPGPPPPAMVRPNGFPMVGPPGFYNPPPIGPNGFPVLSPPPPVVSPR